MKILSKYREELAFLDAAIRQGRREKGDVRRFQELAYRIGALETVDILQKTAPATTDMKRVQAHYTLLNDLLCYMQAERLSRFRQEDADRLADALEACGAIQKDIQKRFGSYKAASGDTYPADIRAAVKAFLPAWLRMRDIILPVYINKQKEDIAS